MDARRLHHFARFKHFERKLSKLSGERPKCFTNKRSIGQTFLSASTGYTHKTERTDPEQLAATRGQNGGGRK